MVAFTLKIDGAAANRIAKDAAFRRVTDTTRRVLNRATVLTPVDTGRLRAGNQSRVRRTANGAVGEIFNLTDYAAPVHDGSRAHVIRPKAGKVLRFMVGGEVVYARSVRMPARKGRPWMYRALVEIAGPEGYTVTRR